MGRRILIVEDDADIAHLVELNLREPGVAIRIASRGDAGLQICEREEFDLIVLDLMLPGVDGLEVCRRLRARGDFTPILMLTAKSTEIDRVVGLEVGADDYLAKPFGIAELVARVRALLRRSGEWQARSNDRLPAQMRHDELVVDVVRRSVIVGDRPVALTVREFDLLTHFVRNPGRVYTRAQLLDAVWGYNHDGYEHTVNSHINRLRAKIEGDPERPRYVLTVWGVGYKFAEPGGA
jgi:DNA-binding response OmpR family regulator